MPKVETSNLGPVELANLQDDMRERHRRISREAHDLDQRAAILRADRDVGFWERIRRRLRAWRMERRAEALIDEAREIRFMLRAGREEVYVHRYGRRALHRQAGGR